MKDYIKIDKKYRLKLNVEAYQKIAKKLQITWTDRKAVYKKLGNPSSETIAVLVWGNLLWEHPGLKIGQVEKWLQSIWGDHKKVKILKKKIIKAFILFDANLDRANLAMNQLKEKAKSLENSI